MKVGPFLQKMMSKVMGGGMGGMGGAMPGGMGGMGGGMPGGSGGFGGDGFDDIRE